MIDGAVTLRRSRADKENILSNLRPLVIVLSRNYSTGLGVIRSLGAAGYTVDLVASTKKKGSSVIASCSKYVHAAVEVLSPKIQGDSGEGLLRVLDGYAKDRQEKMVLFPADDFTAAVVAANQEKLRAHFYMPEVRSMSFSEAMDKTVQGQLAREAGLRTPDEWVIDLRGDIVIPDGVSYPCFVKPLQSVSGQKTEMKKCYDEKALKDHLTTMQAFFRDRAVLVQEFLHIDKEYDLSGVCLDQEIIIPAVIEKTHIARHERGVTMAGKMQPVDVLGDAREKVFAMLRKLRYVGMFDMEFNLCGDKIYFNEINLRSGGPNFSYYLNGVNLPAVFVKALTGERHTADEVEMSVFGKQFVYEKVAWEDYIHGYMTRNELRQCIAAADHTLLANGDDPEPGRYFFRRIRLSAMKHRVMMALGREQRKTADDRPCVVVAGRNYGNILTMSRDLGQAGYAVKVLRVYKKKPSRLNLLAGMKPDARSRYVSAFSECVVNGEAQKIVSRLMDMAAGERMLLMPVDDYTACVIDENWDTLSKQYFIPNVGEKRGEISRLMDKNEQKRLAAAFNLPMLQSVLVTAHDGAYTLPECIRYPCFIKPNVSMKSTKGKMQKCDDEAQLRKVLDHYAKTEDFEILVEEFARIRTEYSILGISTKDTIASPGFFRATEGGHKERKGVALTGEMVDAAPYRSIIDACSRFIRSLGYTGLFDVDLIEDEDGKVYFVELNFRAGASTHVLTDSGVNLPGMLADYLVKGIAVNGDCRVHESGKRFVSEKVLLEEFARSDADVKKVKRCMRDADVHFIRDEKDPAPYRYFRRFYAVAALMRLPYRMRDRKRG